MSLSSEKKFLKKLGTSWENATPGFVIQAYHRGQRKLDLRIGKTFEIYDWASLTKMVLTASILMRAVSEKKCTLKSSLAESLPWFPKSDFQVRVADLLSHSAGLTWWHPYYQSITKELRIDPTLRPGKGSIKSFGREQVELRWSVLQKELTKTIKQSFKIRQKAERDRDANFLDLKSGKPKAVYSDLDLLSLGFFIEHAFGESFLDVAHSQLERMGFHDTDFHVGNVPQHKISKIAPTENCTWRKRILVGEVHDENTWAMGGVAPHSGLFGPMDDLARWGLLLRKGLVKDHDVRGWTRAKTMQAFAKRAIPRARGDWASGMMMPSKGSASCGKYFSASSVGHLGFTGTSLWFDPKMDLLVTILSNRVHPTRENKLFAGMRSSLHNYVVESLALD